MVQSSRPVDRDIAFAAIEARSAFHATSAADSAKVKQTVKDRAIVADVVFPLLFNEGVHVVGCDLGEEVDVFVGVELGHLKLAGWFGALRRVLVTISYKHWGRMSHVDFHFLVQAGVQY